MRRGLASLVSGAWVCSIVWCMESTLEEKVVDLCESGILFFTMFGCLVKKKSSWALGSKGGGGAGAGWSLSSFLCGVSGGKV